MTKAGATEFTDVEENDEGIKKHLFARVPALLRVVEKTFLDRCIASAGEYFEGDKSANVN